MARLLTSPAQRCRQTLEPLARATGLVLEPVAALAEGRSGAVALGLIETLTQVTALCSHGDVIGELLEILHARGVIGAGELRAAKGSRWVLTLECGSVVAARYHGPERVHPSPADA